MRYNENAQYEQTHPLVTRHSVGGTDLVVGRNRKDDILASLHLHNRFHGKTARRYADFIPGTAHDHHKRMERHQDAGFVGVFRPVSHKASNVVSKSGRRWNLDSLHSLQFAVKMCLIVGTITLFFTASILFCALVIAAIFTYSAIIFL